MRNAALVSTMGYLACDRLLHPFGDTGVWLALLLSYLFRAATLATRLPALRRRVAATGLA